MRANRPGRWARWARVGLAAVLAASGAVATARGQEAGAGAGAGPGRHVAAEGLVGYLEFAGLDARRDAWRQTAAAKLLDETGLGAMLRSVAGQVAANLQAGRPEVREAAGRVVPLVDRVLGSGFAIGVHAGDGRVPSVVVAAAGLGRADVRPAVEAALRGLAAPGSRVETVARGKREVTVIAPPSGRRWAHWFEGEDLMLTFVEPGADAAFAATDGRAPNALASPRRAALAAEEGGFRPVVLGFLDVEVLPLPPTPPELGLDGLKRIEYRWGFRGEALEGVARVVAPAPRKGLLALLDQPAFRPEEATVPAGVDEYAVLSVDPARSLDAILAVLRAVEPGRAGEVEAALKEFDAALGVDLKADLLAQLGPKATAYVAPQAVRAPLTPFDGLSTWIFHIPRLTLALDVKDPAAFAPTLDRLMERANAELARLARENGLPGVPAFRPVARGAAKGYALDLPPEVAPLPAGLRPAVLLGDRLAISTSPDSAAEALAVAAGGGARPPFADRLPERLTFLGVTDPRVATPDLLVNLPFFLNLLAKAGDGTPGRELAVLRVKVDPESIPTAEALRARMAPGVTAVSVDDEGLTVTTIGTFPGVNIRTSSPVAVALLLPAVQSARSAARRAQSVNNLKQIAVAMHNYHHDNGHFPAAAICDDRGKPLLSWRVAILPYIEERELYDAFRKDEPWDSPHNLALLDRMPSAYAAPTGNAPPGQTFYQVFVGNGAAFEVADPASMHDITDGTAMTLMAVEAVKPVPWTKPEDIPFRPGGPPPKLGGMNFPGGFDAAFMDGSIRFLKTTTDARVLKALITRSGGEIIRAGDF